MPTPRRCMHEAGPHTGGCVFGVWRDRHRSRRSLFQRGRHTPEHRRPTNRSLNDHSFRLSVCPHCRADCPAEWCVACGDYLCVVRRPPPPPETKTRKHETSETVVSGGRFAWTPPARNRKPQIRVSVASVFRFSGYRQRPPTTLCPIGRTLTMASTRFMMGMRNT